MQFGIRAPRYGGAVMAVASPTAMHLREVVGEAPLPCYRVEVC